MSASGSGNIELSQQNMNKNARGGRPCSQLEVLRADARKTALRDEARALIVDMPINILQLIACCCTSKSETRGEPSSFATGSEFAASGISLKCPPSYIT